MEDPDQPTAYPLMMFNFEYPRLKPIDFTKYIVTSKAASRDFLHGVGVKRTELAQLLTNKKQSPSATQIIRHVESLFPMIMGLFQVMTSPGTQFKQKIPFSWSSPVHFKDKHTFATISSKSFEMLMLCNLLACAHGNRALEHIRNWSPEDDFDEPAKKAVEELRIAAGLFDWMAKIGIPKWTTPPVSVPFECNATVALSMRNLCLSMGQAIVVRKALIHGTSKQVVAKLSVGGFRKAETAFKAVIGMKESKSIHTNFKDFLHAHAVVHKANALKCLGDAAYDEEKYGEAIGFLKAASTSSKKVTRPKDKNSPLYAYKEDIATVQSIIHHKAELYVQQNDNIFGKKEVPETDVDIPDGTVMVKPTPFAVPKASFRSI